MNLIFIDENNNYEVTNHLILKTPKTIKNNLSLKMPISLYRA